MSEAQQAAELSIIVPTWRTGQYASTLCARIEKTAAALGAEPELIFVVDGCPSGSADLIRQIVCPLPLRIIELEQNIGQDAAIREGLRQCRGLHALVLDGDLQDPPEILQQLWPLRSTFDAVFAARTGRGHSTGRQMTSWLYRSLMRPLAGLPQGAGLFVLMNRRVIDFVAATNRPRISVLAAIAASRGRFTSIPVQRSSSSERQSGYSGWDRLHKAALSFRQSVGALYFGMKL